MLFTGARGRLAGGRCPGPLRAPRLPGDFHDWEPRRACVHWVHSLHSGTAGSGTAWRPCTWLLRAQQPTHHGPPGVTASLLTACGPRQGCDDKEPVVPSPVQRQDPPFTAATPCCCDREPASSPGAAAPQPPWGGGRTGFVRWAPLVFLIYQVPFPFSRRPGRRAACDAASGSVTWDCLSVGLTEAPRPVGGAPGGGFPRRTLEVMALSSD